MSLTSRPLRANLLRDGYEAAAESVSHTLRRNRHGSNVVLVNRAGEIRVRPLCELPPDDADAVVLGPACIGTFDGSAKIEAIEDNLLMRQRELSA